MRIVDENTNEVTGSFHVSDNETLLTFYPGDKWKPGLYVLGIEPRLEDLAGNNLNHLFDTDLVQEQLPSKTVFKISFRVR